MPNHDIHAKDLLIKDVLTVMRRWHDDRLTSVQETWIREVLEAHLPGPRQGDLFAPAPPRESTRITRLVTRMLCGDDTCHDPLALQALKLTSVIGDLRAGRSECVQPWEASAVEAVIGPVAVRTPDVPAHNVASPDPVPVNGPVEFCFSWPSGSARAPRTGSSTALAALSEVDPVDAPVACSLRTPAGRLEVRRLGPLWLRPVLTPGSWRPVTVAGFRQAAGSGAAWRDNPFLSRAHRGSPDFPLPDIPNAPTIAKGDDRRLSDAREACIARAGELFAIKGIVHRSTTAPRAGVCVVHQEGVDRACAAWVVGDLGSTGGMDTLAHREGVVLTWFDGRSRPKPDGGQDPDDVFVPLSDWMGVVRAASVGEVHPWSGGTPHPPFERDLVRLNDAGASASDTRTCLDVARNLAGRLSPVSPGLDHEGGSAGAFGGMRDALSRTAAARDAAGGVLERACIALRHSGADVLDATSTATGPRDGMWAYVATLALHVAAHELDPRNDAEELASLRL